MGLAAALIRLLRIALSSLTGWEGWQALRMAVQEYLMGAGGRLSVLKGNRSRGRCNALPDSYVVFKECMWKSGVDMTYPDLGSSGSALLNPPEGRLLLSITLDVLYLSSTVTLLLGGSIDVLVCFKSTPNTSTSLYQPISLDVRTQLLLSPAPLTIGPLASLIVITINVLGWLIRSTTLQSHDTGVYEAVHPSLPTVP